MSLPEVSRERQSLLDEAGQLCWAAGCLARITWYVRATGTGSVRCACDSHLAQVTGAAIGDVVIEVRPVINTEGR